MSERVLGPVDIPANSRSTSAAGWVLGTRGSTEVGVRGGYFTENRNNGTPQQINATISRWGSVSAHGLAGGGAWEATGDLSRGNYRQTFSAVLGANRTSERLTSLQWVHPGSGGFSMTSCPRSHRRSKCGAAAQRYEPAGPKWPRKPPTPPR